MSDTNEPATANINFAGVSLGIDPPLPHLPHLDVPVGMNLSKEDNITISVYRNTTITTAPVPTMRGVVDEPRDDDKGIRSIDDTPFFTAENTPEKMSNMTSPVPLSSFVVEGIIGTDQNGGVYAPQRSTYVYNRHNANHAKRVKEEIAKQVQEWNAIEGCSCKAFSLEMKGWDGPALTAVSGITHGFKVKDIPVTPKPAEKRAQNDGGADDDVSDAPGAKGGKKK